MPDDIKLTRPTAQAREDGDDIPSNPLTQPTIGEIISRRFGRRDAIKGMLGVTAMTAIASPVALMAGQAKAQAGSFNFDELVVNTGPDHAVAPGYDAQVLIRWGDPVVPGAPAFDPMNHTADDQELQFGYNNDFVGYLPLPLGSDNSEHGLLTVNHEYTNEELMFPNYTEDTEATTSIEMAAHGLTVIEVMKEDGVWTYKADSEYNRRLSGRSGRFTVSGPAAGHDRLKTSVDPTGLDVVGTLNNCAGGVTPWGTILSAEENFHGYFGGELTEDHAEYRNYSRYGVPGGWYNWHVFNDRFDITKEANEANRFGWMVEIDPYDPTSTPVKRTAMGRFKHEAGYVVIDEATGKAVVYMGDDQRFDYVYKFVSEGTFDANNREANFGLLDEGTLYVAKFNEDSTVDWLPLVHGHGPLTAENGFNSQADVVIEARVAADLLGATPMDRPEDIEGNSETGRVFVMLTNNSRREEVNAANPRVDNQSGHIIEIVTNGDHVAEQSGWEFVVLCGDMADESTTWNPATTENGWFTDPDNCAIDHRGRLWVTTDGNSPSGSGRNDGVWALETEGELAGTSKHFYSVPLGAEMCGPFFTPNDETLFVAVQHPGDADGSTFETPVTRWPDFDESLPTRPSVVAIVKQGGGMIG